MNKLSTQKHLSGWMDKILIGKLFLQEHLVVLIKNNIKNKQRSLHLTFHSQFTLLLSSWTKKYVHLAHFKIESSAQFKIKPTAQFK